MGQAVRINLDGLKQLQKNVEDLKRNQEQIMTMLTDKIAALLLRKVIFRTPVGNYDNDFDVYKRDNKKKGIKAGDIKKDKKGNLKRKSYKSITYAKNGVERTNIYRRTGGTLRKGWTVSQVIKNGSTYSVEVINTVPYASYAEYGHRQTPGRFVAVLGKKLKRAWVPGRFMLTISENEIKENMDAILEKKLDSILKKVFGNAK